MKGQNECGGVLFHEMAAFNCDGRDVHSGMKVYGYQTVIQQDSCHCWNCKDSDRSGTWTRRLTRNLPSIYWLHFYLH
jgi:hypothetical protein